MSNNERKARIQRAFTTRLPVWRNSIADFAADNFSFVPDEWQAELFRNVESFPRVAVKSGQGVGKTGAEAVIALWFLTCHPNAKVVCTAPTKHQLNDVLWAEMSKWQKRSPILSIILKWTKTYIYVKNREERWFAVARTATKPENMQGFHEDNMLFIVDEASGVADDIMEAIQGTLSGVNNKLVACGNPTRASGFFYDCFTSAAALWARQTVNSEDSPRTNRDNIQALKDKYGAESNVVRVRVYGGFPTAEDDVFIPISLVEAAIAHDLQPHGHKIERITLGVDVARFGDDETVIASNVDGDIKISDRRHGQDTMRTVGDIVRRCTALLAEHPKYRDQIYVIVDDTGVGGGVTDRLNELKREGTIPRVTVIPINFGEKIPDEDAAVYYDDLPTYMWSIVRDLMRDKLIKLPDNSDMVAQFSTRKYTISSAGKVKIESKRDMKKRQIKSPDIADAVVLSCYKRRVFNIKNLI